MRARPKNTHAPRPPSSLPNSRKRGRHGLGRHAQEAPNGGGRAGEDAQQAADGGDDRLGRSSVGRLGHREKRAESTQSEGRGGSLNSWPALDRQARGLGLAVSEGGWAGDWARGGRAAGRGTRSVCRGGATFENKLSGRWVRARESVLSVFVNPRPHVGAGHFPRLQNTHAHAHAQVHTHTHTTLFLSLALHTLLVQQHQEKKKEARRPFGLCVPRPSPPLPPPPPPAAWRAR